MLSYNVNMIEDLRNKLPEELVWNVLKYTEHPCATIMKEEWAYKAAERYGDQVAEWERLETLALLRELARLEPEERLAFLEDFEPEDRLALLEELEQVGEWEPESEEEWERVD